MDLNVTYKEILPESLISCNEKIKSNPLSILTIFTEQTGNLVWNGTTHENIWTNLSDLSKCINLQKLNYKENFLGNVLWDKPKIPIRLNLSNCIKLTQLNLENITQITIDNLNLSNCVHLTQLTINISSEKCMGNMNKLNLSKCVNLTHLDLTFYESSRTILLYGSVSSLSYGTINLSNCINLLSVSLREFVVTKYYKPTLPDMSGCINLIKFVSISDYSIIKLEYPTHEKQIEYPLGSKIHYNNIDLSLFPRMIYYNGNNVEHYNKIIEMHKTQKESLLLLIESKFNKLEKENKELRKHIEEENIELRKIIDELRPIKSSYM